MGGLLAQLGVDWRLLLSQGVNFLIVLGALTVLVYRPLMKTLKERSERIDFGLKGADEVEKKLNAIDGERDEKLREAERSAVSIIAGAERDAKAKTAQIMDGAKEKAESIVHEARELVERRREEELEKLGVEAHHLIRAALAKTVELDPGKVDDALIKEAVAEIRKGAK